MLGFQIQQEKQKLQRLRKQVEQMTRAANQASADAAAAIALKADTSALLVTDGKTDANATALGTKADASALVTTNANVAANTANMLANKGDIAANAAAIAAITTPKMLKAFGTLTSSVRNITVDLVWAAPTIDQHGGNVRITSDVVQFTTGGVYKFSVSVQTTNANRAELIVQMKRGGVAQAAEIASDYVSRDIDQNTGGVTLTTAITVADGEQIEFTAHSDADGTSDLLTDGTILLVEGPY